TAVLTGADAGPTSPWMRSPLPAPQAVPEVCAQTTTARSNQHRSGRDTEPMLALSRSEPSGPQGQGELFRDTVRHERLLASPRPVAQARLQPCLEGSLRPSLGLDLGAAKAEPELPDVAGLVRRQGEQTLAPVPGGDPRGCPQARVAVGLGVSPVPQDRRDEQDDQMPEAGREPRAPGRICVRPAGEGTRRTSGGTKPDLDVAPLHAVEPGRDHLPQLEVIGVDAGIDHDPHPGILRQGNDMDVIPPRSPTSGPDGPRRPAA